MTDHLFESSFEQQNVLFGDLLERERDDVGRTAGALENDHGYLLADLGLDLDNVPQVAANHQTHHGHLPILRLRLGRLVLVLVFHQVLAPVRLERAREQVLEPAAELLVPPAAVVARQVVDRGCQVDGLLLGELQTLVFVDDEVRVIGIGVELVGLGATAHGHTGLVACHV